MQGAFSSSDDDDAPIIYGRCGLNYHLTRVSVSSPKKARLNEILMRLIPLTTSKIEVTTQLTVDNIHQFGPSQGRIYVENRREGEHWCNLMMLLEAHYGAVLAPGRRHAAMQLGVSTTDSARLLKECNEYIRGKKGSHADAMTAQRVMERFSALTCALIELCALFEVGLDREIKTHRQWRQLLADLKVATAESQTHMYLGGRVAGSVEEEGGAKLDGSSCISRPLIILAMLQTVNNWGSSGISPPIFRSSSAPPTVATASRLQVPVNKAQLKDELRVITSIRELEQSSNILTSRVSLAASACLLYPVHFVYRFLSGLAFLCLLYVALC